MFKTLKLGSEGVACVQERLQESASPLLLLLFLPHILDDLPGASSIHPGRILLF